MVKLDLKYGLLEEKMENLTSELAELFSKSHHLEEEIKKNLGGIGYEF